MNYGGAMSLVDGIGGAFLFSNNPKALVAWYQEVLGILPTGQDEECKSVYKTFEYRDLADPSLKKTITWAIIPAEKDISNKSRTGQINYRVKSMDVMIAHLKTKGIVIEEAKSYEYGKFAWVRDPEGNRVELFEEL
jgi:predicted enzyme related to lactoylglutathione lyase